MFGSFVGQSPLRQAPKRCTQAYKKTLQKEKVELKQIVFYN
jgi:hypothetical protein